MEQVELFVTYISYATKLIAFAVIVWGMLMAFYHFVILEFKQIKGENICSKRENLRHHFGSYLLLGFEILIAADVLSTLFNPSWEELVDLAIIVAIRTLLNFFLNKELAADGHSCKLN